MRGVLAVIEPAPAEGLDRLGERAGEIAEVALGLLGIGDADIVVEVVGPDGVEADAVFPGGKDEAGIVA
jgi:hypothetical protein